MDCKAKMACPKNLHSDGLQTDDMSKEPAFRWTSKQTEMARPKNQHSDGLQNKDGICPKNLH